MQRRQRRARSATSSVFPALIACFALGCGARSQLESGGSERGGRGSTPTAIPPLPDAAAPDAAVDAGLPSPPPTRFAVIGDYGTSGSNEKLMAELVLEFDPAFIITTGDNNYPSGSADTIDANIGQYFHTFIAPYRGMYGEGASKNRFFPSLGNHDWLTPGAQPYLDYFELPHNERYYDVVQDGIHLFAIDSDTREPDGIGASSAQAAWLEQRLTASRARWKIVYFHHPPYSSGAHGSSPELRWPYREWGASVVYSGHDHIYERFSIDGFPYVVNGVGGKELYRIGTLQPGSQVAINDVHGAVLVTASDSELISQFVSVEGLVLDELRLTAQ
ncbi:MAG TPA: metallophosphoesterase [Polyangiaceae bacterium]|nr:metallophosphoesterase [Polyangiaceae bacterium]